MLELVTNNDTKPHPTDEARSHEYCAHRHAETYVTITAIAAREMARATASLDALPEGWHLKVHGKPWVKTRDGAWSRYATIRTSGAMARMLAGEEL